MSKNIESHKLENASNKSRDEFRRAIVSDLRKRAGEKCSNPECSKPTSGPKVSSEGSVTIGVAAHIYAAAKNGPRFNEHMSSAERSDIKNAIWLCQGCSKLIDSDIARYPPELLYNWKSNAESRAFADISTSNYSSIRLGHDVPIQVELSVQEYIELGDNNLFFGSESDLILGVRVN